MAFDDYEMDDSFNTRVNNSGNSTTSSNTLDIGVVADNVLNEDNSVSGSFNGTVDVSGSGNEDSNDTDIDTYVDIIGSGNDDSDNSTTTNTDNSEHDHSINAGLRAYDTGFGELTGAAAAGGTGDVWVNDADTIVDQSINANVAGGFVLGGSASHAVVASGAGAYAAGDDVDVRLSQDDSVSFEADGDLNYGNTTTVDLTLGSGNTATDNSTTDVTYVDVEIEESFNDGSETWTADSSFNAEIDSVQEENWDVDANVIWGSGLSGIADDVAL